MRWAQVIVLGMALCACGGGGGGDGGGDGGSDGDGGGAPLPLDSLEEELVTLWCGQFACRYPDNATCLEVTSFDNDFCWVIAGVEAGRTVYDAQKARDCVDLLAALDNCEEYSFGFWYWLLDRNFDWICGSVFVGTVPLDGDCFDDIDCVGDNECMFLNGNPENGAGACVLPDETPPARLGEPCTLDCVWGAVCDGTVCVERPRYSAGPGTACTTNSDCTRPDNYCDEADFTCQPRARVGEPCTIINPGSSEDNCVPYAWCDPTATCVQRPGLGDSCEPGERCIDGLRCSDADMCDFGRSDCPSRS